MSSRKLIVGVEDPAHYNVVVELMSGVSGVDAVNVVPREFHCNGMNAEILPCMLALERYGGNLKMGQSQVLSTRGEENMPPWVVSTPAGSPNGGWRQKADGSREWYDDRSLTEEEIAFELFSEVFAAVSRYHAEEGVELNIIGVSLDLFMSFSSYEAVALGLRMAYEQWALS